MEYRKVVNTTELDFGTNLRKQARILNVPALFSVSIDLDAHTMISYMAELIDIDSQMLDVSQGWSLITPYSLWTIFVVFCMLV